MILQTAIKTTNLTKEFDKKNVVNNLNIEINKGEIFGFLGPNGSGKSTTIKMLCGLIMPTSGDATVKGYSIKNEGETIRKQIGYMSQRFSLYDDLTSKENLLFYSQLYKVDKELLESRISEIMEMTKITKEQNKKVSKLSGGFKQRLAFACALVNDPQIVFLDEPTAGIDPVARRDIWDLFFRLADSGLTFFVTTHYMDEAERCTKLGYIINGNLVAYGPTATLAGSKQELEDLFVSLTKSQDAN